MCLEFMNKMLISPLSVWIIGCHQIQWNTSGQCAIHFTYNRYEYFIPLDLSFVVFFFNIKDKFVCANLSSCREFACANLAHRSLLSNMHNCEEQKQKSTFSSTRSGPLDAYNYIEIYNLLTRFSWNKNSFSDSFNFMMLLFINLNFYSFCFF